MNLPVIMYRLNAQDTTTTTTTSSSSSVAAASAAVTTKQNAAIGQRQQQRVILLQQQQQLHSQAQHLHHHHHQPTRRQQQQQLPHEQHPSALLAATTKPTTTTATATTTIPNHSLIQQQQHYDDDDVAADNDQTLAKRRTVTIVDNDELVVIAGETNRRSRRRKTTESQLAAMKMPAGAIKPAISTMSNLAINIPQQHPVQQARCSITNSDEYLNLTTNRKLSITDSLCSIDQKLQQQTTTEFNNIRTTTTPSTTSTTSLASDNIPLIKTNHKALTTTINNNNNHHITDAMDATISSNKATLVSSNAIKSDVNAISAITIVRNCSSSCSSSNSSITISGNPSASGLPANASSANNAANTNTLIQHQHQLPIGQSNSNAINSNNNNNSLNVMTTMSTGLNDGSNLVFVSTKRPRIEMADEWITTISPGSSATAITTTSAVSAMGAAAVAKTAPLSPTQNQIFNASLSNGYASPLSAGSYDPFSPNSKTGREDLSPSSSLNGFSSAEVGGVDVKKIKKGPAPRLQEELCLVCGDRASGYHYNALTCEGCKGFFRRSVTKSAVYCCKFGHACEMDMYMRRKCQECRLKKCLAVGMRPECVVPENQCAMKRREKKAQKEKDKLQNTTVGAASTDFIKKEMLDLMACEPPTHPTCPLLPEDILAKCQARNIPPLTYNQLAVIYKLIWYQDGYEQPSEEDLKRIMVSSPDENESQHDISFRHITEITILTVQLIVEFAKGLPAFTKIPQEDQITLLKACSSEVMMLRMARRYDHNSDSIFFANNRSYTRDSYKMAGMADNIEDLLHFCRQMYAMKVDNVEYALLTAIVIFSDRPGLEKAELVEAIQSYYIDTLRIYILNRHCGDAMSLVFFAKLLSILTELRTLGNQNAEMCFSLKLKNRKLPKFLEEIWDVHAIPPSVQSHIQTTEADKVVVVHEAATTSAMSTSMHSMDVSPTSLHALPLCVAASATTAATLAAASSSSSTSSIAISPNGYAAYAHASDLSLGLDGSESHA